MSTMIHTLQRYRSIGCKGCRNKTEGKLVQWLRKTFSDARVTHGTYRGPGQTRFDFYLKFPDDFEVLVELDGAQHFWNSQRFFTDDGCRRDLQKEQWALERGLCVVRVLQEDVWLDRLDWEGWLIRSIKDARTSEACVFTPDAPEYTGRDSAYVQVHDQS